MQISPIDADVQYRLLNAAAHSRVTPSVQAPALVAHLARWCEFPLNESDRRKWRLEVDKAVSRIIVHFGEKIFLNDAISDDWLVLFNHIAPINKPNDLRAPSKDFEIAAQQNYLLIADLRSINIKAQLESDILEIRFELHSEYCSATFYLSPGSREAVQRGDASEANGLGCAFIDLAKHYRADRLDVNSIELLRKRLFEDMWDELLQKLPFFSNSESKNLGYFFADFRGLIIDDTVLPLACEVGSPIPLKWGTRAAEALQSLAGASEREEATASYMLDGRVFYMTTLAPPPLRRKNEVYSPLTFVMYAHQNAPNDRMSPMVNRHQLGRLIDRLFLLGTARLAALIDLEKLRNAGRILASLEPEARKARFALGSGDEYESDAVVRNFNKAIDDLEIEGGIEYRVERSRYYLEQFSSSIDGLRLMRVEGFQPYDKFVRQKLGARFDFIDRLGRRYERATNNNYRLSQASLALRLTNVQLSGEVIVFMGLLPYYIGNLIEGVLGEVSWEITAGLWAIFFGVGAFRLTKYHSKLRQLPKIMKVICVVVASVGFFYFLAYLHHKYGKKEAVYFDTIILPAAA